MKTAKLFVNGRSQAVRLPKEFQFKGNNVYIQKIGDAVILIPYEKSWELFLKSLDTFSEDFLSDNRNDLPTEDRIEL